MRVRCRATGNRRRLLGVPLVLVLGLVALATPSPAAEPVSFRTQVAPILARKCLGCHNNLKAESAFDLSSFARLRRGGEIAAEEVVVAGDPAGSYLIESVRGGAAKKMPPQGPGLNADEIAALTRWVKEGAKSDGPSPETPLIAMVDPLQHLPAVRPKKVPVRGISSLAFDPTGSRLAATQGETVSLFDTATGKLAGELRGHPGPLTALAFAAGSSLAACGGRPGQFGSTFLWDASSRTQRGELRGHSDAILAAAAHGNVLATAGYDRTIQVWDLSGTTLVQTLREHTDVVTGLAFSPDGTRLASCSWDRTVRLWDWKAAKRVLTLSESTGELNAVAFTPDGKHVLAAGSDRSIRIWAVAGDRTEAPRSVFAHDGGIVRLAVSPDGKTLASGGEDRRVKLWRLPGLEPAAEPPGQADWPQALAFSPDGRRLAIGRLDGSLELVDATTGKPGLALLKAGEMKPRPAPALVRNVALNPPSPRGVTRGKTTRLTLAGHGVGRATAVVFREPGLSAALVAAAKPEPDRVEVDLKVAADARAGLHAFTVLTPLGTPAFQTLAVTGSPEVAEAKDVVPFSLPATLVGTIEAPGDVDRFRFDAKAGQEIAFEPTARALGSVLEPVLDVIDAQGRPLEAVAAARPGRDPVTVVRIPADGRFTLQVGDLNYGGSGGHFYRIDAGRAPVVRSAFPLGISRGGSAKVALRGWNLSKSEATVAVGNDVPAGTLVAVPVPATAPPLIAAADGPQAVEQDRSEGEETAQEIAVPGGVSGRIARDGEADRYAFHARKGERLIVEVFARRLGSPLDPVVEILDAHGRTVPRAILRPLDQTEVAFRDHGSAQPGIRLTRWSNLSINDYVMIGREVARIQALPRNPDDDCTFWSESGQRMGQLETTPEQHPVGQPIYRVEVLPPGAKLPPGGVSPVTLTYRNDDGGPSFQKDARVTFDPPEDGLYQARVTDARGLGGEDSGYHLVVRRPRPDFQVFLGTENPNVPRGGTALVPVSVARLDGFDEPVEVRAEGLPEGVTATPAVIDAGHREGILALAAEATAPAFSAPTWTVTAEAQVKGVPAKLRKTIDPGGAQGGWITVIAPTGLRVAANPRRVVVVPGRETAVRLSVERPPGMTGRVPIDVRNLPQGVRVLDIGLNGVLITEKEQARSVRIYAEPWVTPRVRPFYAVGRIESAGTEASSVPLELEIRAAAPR